MKPYISCLCPTFQRPDLLANLLACFLAQDYPKDRCNLIILDDSGDFEKNQQGDNWTLITQDRRYPSLPEKYNALAQAAQVKAELLVVMEDDDIYLPHHLTVHADAYAKGQFTKPSKVLSLYSGRIEDESAAGRFHASIGLSVNLFHQVGGWVVTRQANFDQQFIQVLTQAAGISDPCDYGPPSYVFRYGSTGHYHGQHYMNGGPTDETWYDKIPQRPTGLFNLKLQPQFDPETMQTYDQLA